MPFGGWPTGALEPWRVGNLPTLALNCKNAFSAGRPGKGEAAGDPVGSRSDKLAALAGGDRVPPRGSRRPGAPGLVDRPETLRREFEGTEAGGVVVNLCRRDQLVRVGRG